MHIFFLDTIAHRCDTTASGNMVGNIVRVLPFGFLFSFLLFGTSYEIFFYREGGY